MSRAVCIPRSADARAPRELVEEWLAARNFEASERVPEWPCDEKLERGFFLFCNQRWTVLLYSGIDGELDEDNRLLLHLGRTGGPLLYAWSYGGMAWGYRIHDGRDVTDAYNSRGGVGPPEWLTEHPSHGDLRYLCETFDLPVDPRVLATIRGSRVIAREHVAARFFDALGAGPAAAGYADVEWRFLNEAVAGTFGGFAAERGYYVRRGFRPGGSTLKLHEVVPRVNDAAGDRGWWPGISFDIDPGYVLGMMRLFALIGLVLRPIAWAAVAIGRTASWADRFYRVMGWDQRTAHGCAFADEVFEGGRDAFVVRDGGRLRNALRRCEVTLPAGADVKAMPRECRGTFLFSIGRVVVACDAVRPDADGHIRRMFHCPRGFAVTADEAFTAGGHPARLIAWKLAPEAEDETAVQAPRRRPAPVRVGFVNHWVVQTPVAFFEFSCGTATEPQQARVVAAMREVVGSFRTDDGAGAEAVIADRSAAGAAGSIAS